MEEQNLASASDQRKSLRQWTKNSILIAKIRPETVAQQVGNLLCLKTAAHLQKSTRATKNLQKAEKSHQNPGINFQSRPTVYQYFMNRQHCPFLKIRLHSRHSRKSHQNSGTMLSTQSTHWSMRSPGHIDPSNRHIRQT